MNALNLWLSSCFGTVPEALGTVLLFGASAFGIGEFVLRRTVSDRPFLSFAFGLAVLGVLFQGGFAVLFLPCPVWSGLLLFPASYGLYRLFFPIRKHPWATLTLCLWGGATLGAALLPPFSWDEQVYQLALPLRFLSEQSGAVRPDNPYSAFPLLPNFLYMAGIQLGGVQLPRLLNWILTPALLGFVWFSARRFGRFPAWCATAAAALSPLTLALNRNVYVENFIALFALAGISAALCLRKRLLFAGIIAGVLAGAAVAVKLTGAGAALMIFCFLPKNKKTLGAFLLAAAVTAGGFYLRPWLATGNPFYPFVPGAAPGTVAHFHHLLGSARYGIDGISGIALSWLFAAFDGKIFDGIALGWQFIAFGLAAAAGCLRWRMLHPGRMRFLLPPAAAAICGYLFWAATSQQSRFLFPLFLFSAIAGSAGCFILKGKTGKIAAMLFVVAALAHPLWWNPVKHYAVSWRIAGHAPENYANFLIFSSRDRGYFTALDYLASTPAESRVLLLFERRGLYVPRRYEIAAPLFEPSLTPLPKTPEELMARFRNFDFILVGSTERDVDFQNETVEECNALLPLLKTLIDQGKLEKIFLPDAYPLLRNRQRNQ